VHLWRPRPGGLTGVRCVKGEYPYRINEIGGIA
jgi:hypothetical protein